MILDNSICTLIRLSVHLSSFSHTFYCSRCFEYSAANDHQSGKDIKSFLTQTVWIFHPDSLLLTESQSRVSQLGTRVVLDSSLSSRQVIYVNWLRCFHTQCGNDRNSITGCADEKHFMPIFIGIEICKYPWKKFARGWCPKVSPHIPPTSHGADAAASDVLHKCPRWRVSQICSKRHHCTACDKTPNVGNKRTDKIRTPRKQTSNNNWSDASDSLPKNSGWIIAQHSAYDHNFFHQLTINEVLMLL